MRLFVIVLSAGFLFSGTLPAAPPIIRKGPIVSEPVKPGVSRPLSEILKDKARREAAEHFSPQREVLNTYLAKHKAAQFAKVIAIDSAELKTLFPKTTFFALRFSQYPVARSPAPPLKTNNIFAVQGKEVQHLKSADELGKYFQENLLAVKSGKLASSATTEFLRLSREFHQDGYFQFQDPEVKITSGKGGPIANGISKVVAQRGDRGEVTIHMSYLDGKLEAVNPGGKLSPGIRPRCQATRLLHADPAIRDIMRRDLIVLGSSANEYLAEQWQKAGPKLRTAIEDVWRQIQEEGR